MTINDFINKLNQYDKNMEIVFTGNYKENNLIPGAGTIFRSNNPVLIKNTISGKLEIYNKLEKYNVFTTEA